MEMNGVKIDFVGLAAVIMAVAALYAKLKSNSKRKERDHDPKDSQED